jgi:hypothetical protein
MYKLYLKSFRKIPTRSTVKVSCSFLIQSRTFHTSKQTLFLKNEDDIPPEETFEAKLARSLEKIRKHGKFVDEADRVFNSFQRAMDYKMKKETNESKPKSPSKESKPKSPPKEEKESE